MSEIWRHLLLAWILGPPLAVLYFLVLMVGVGVIAQRAAQLENRVPRSPDGACTSL